MPHHYHAQALPLLVKRNARIRSDVPPPVPLQADLAVAYLANDMQNSFECVTQLHVRAQCYVEYMHSAKVYVAQESPIVNGKIC